MNARQALAQLESLGTEQHRKVYRRHGVTGPLFGVSYANLKAMTKKIKRDQSLALDLWASGNHDARVLATMVADPDAFDKETLSDWAKSIDNYVVADAYSAMAAQAAASREIADEWIATDDEFQGQVGWNLIGRLAADPDLPDGYFEGLLKKVEKEIHQSKNRTRHAMNGALISIGLRNPQLERKAIAAAGRIGKVEVDHGETSCKTPDAVSYIKKARERRKKIRR